jgi:ABC-type glycerol-3-phosphate transport system substrate-binding protein
MQNQNNTPFPVGNNPIHPQPGGSVPGNTLVSPPQQQPFQTQNPTAPVPNRTSLPPPASLPVSQLPPQPLVNLPTSAPTSIPTKIPTMSAQDAQNLQAIANKANKQLKKGLLKKLLLVVAVIFILGAGAYFALKFKPADVATFFGKKGEITWWGLYLDEADLAPLIQEYQNNSNVKITYVKQSPVDYRVRLTSALASGNGPDIFEIHNSWPAMFRNELATLPPSVMEKDEFAQTFYPIIVSDLTLGGEIVGMPLEYDAIALYINEDIFAAGAKQPPETWDELKELSKDLAQKGEGGGVGQFGIAMGTIDNVDHWPEVVALMMLQNGVNLAKPTGTSATSALAYYRLILKDSRWKEAFPPSTIAFARGNTAMYFGPTRRAFEIVQINPSLKFKTVSLPQLPKETPYDPDVSYATYWVQGVWERSTNKEASWEFLKYLSTKESLDKLNQNISAETNLRKMSPRVDSAYSFIKDPILGSIVGLVASSKSWYLADETHDGLTGINSQVNEIYKGIVKSKKASDSAVNSILSLLSEYGISAN